MSGTSLHCICILQAQNVLHLTKHCIASNGFTSSLSQWKGCLKKDIRSFVVNDRSTEKIHCHSFSKLKCHKVIHVIHAIATRYKLPFKL